MGDARGGAGCAWALALLFAISGCGVAPPPDVLLVSVDTLRADRLGAYGDTRGASPRIDAFAERAAVFESAYTTASHTLAAHASLLTGLQPDAHGVLQDGDALSPTLPTLAERLSQAGYRTAAFTNSGYLDPKFGLDRGFDTYDFAHDLGVDRSGERALWGRDGRETNRAVETWLDLHGDAPWFLFVHYFDPHSDWEREPYDAPAELRARFARPRPPGYEPGRDGVFASLHLMALNAAGETLPPAQRDYVSSLYDAGVAHADAAVGELLALLERRGELDGALVVLLSDHGEEFQEHGKFLHVQVFEELLRVPLLLRLPGGRHAGRRVEGVVQLTDVKPTVLAALGLPFERPGSGVDLMPLLAGGAEAERPAFGRNRSGSQYAMRSGRYKLVERRDPAAAYLFDLVDDPGETTSIAGRDRARAEAMRARLHEWQRSMRALRPPAVEAPDLDPAVKEALRVLGYGEG